MTGRPGAWLEFPSSAFADTQVARGETRVLLGRDAAGNRHVLVISGLRPHPWTAFARARRRTNGQPYAAWLESTRARLLAALGTQERPIYPRDVVLGLAMSFGATPRKVGGEKRSTSVLDWDYTNLCKSFEDAMSHDLIFHDDAQVRRHGPGAAIDTTADFMCAHVWQGGPWREEWGEFTIPEVGDP